MTPLIRPLLAGTAIFLLAGLVPCRAEDFKLYPGSKVDEAASREASATVPGKESRVYTTPDSLEKVGSFYKGLYKEITMRSSGPTLPSGEQVRWFFLR